ncbi:hypothetical protein Sste5346_000039 [Sporothrix stenoceras]|uniref:Uncharacterized protein n=1 Tax=Sporothrix stenoceras TaxID=5173 RepID=A0ABR3ZRV8_9PEZI
MAQNFNTERAQLQGSLSAALNDRDIVTAERDSALQEVAFVRGRLDELTKQVHEQHTSSGNQVHGHHTTNGDDRATLGSAKNRNSWAMTTAFLPNGSGRDMTLFSSNPSNGDLPHLPKNVEDMPFSPRAISGGPPSFPNGNMNGSFSSVNQEHPPTAFNHSSHSRSSTPRFSNRGQRNQSKFFAKNGGGAMGPRPPSGYANSSGHSTPDFFNGSPVQHQFSQTPGHGSHGPFRAPPHPPVPQQQQFFGPGNNARAHKRAASSFPSAEKARPAFKSSPAVGSGPPQFQSRNRASPAPRLTMADSTRSQTAIMTPPSQELALVRNDQVRNGQFTAGVVHNLNSQDEDRVRTIFQFFNSIKDWVDKYCGNVVSAEAVQALSHQHPRLWDYACSVTYPNNRNNASSHSTCMLTDKAYRSFFISRLVIQFVVQQMWSPQAWEGMNDQLTDVLVNVKQRLDLKYGYDAVLQPHERHALVEKRSSAIHDFIHQPNWNKYKAQKVSQATTRVKDIVGPMMNVERVDHDSAHLELHGICDDALRLSAMLNTSRLSFQFIFNECGIKFSDQSHQPLNSTISARELTAHHWRVMCVVTPGITYRNDAGVSVDPRFLSKANVLLMQ